MIVANNSLNCNDLPVKNPLMPIGLPDLITTRLFSSLRFIILLAREIVLVLLSSETSFAHVVWNWPFKNLFQLTSSVQWTNFILYARIYIQRYMQSIENYMLTKAIRSSDFCTHLIICLFFNFEFILFEL